MLKKFNFYLVLALSSFLFSCSDAKFIDVEVKVQGGTPSNEGAEVTLSLQRSDMDLDDIKTYINPELRTKEYDAFTNFTRKTDAEGKVSFKVLQELEGVKFTQYKISATDFNGSKTGYEIIDTFNLDGEVVIELK